MSTDYTTYTFYVAPSKERHPLVSQCIREEHVKVGRRDGFLTGEFETYWGTRDDGTRGIIFSPIYEQLCELGYISEDHRTSSWCSNGGDRDSGWYDIVGDKFYKINTRIRVTFHEYGLTEEFREEDAEFFENEDRGKEKEKLQLFWETFPNLMFIMKHGRPPTVEELTTERKCEHEPEERLVGYGSGEY